MTLVPIDPTSAVAVTSYLEQAKTWLATAVEQTGPEQIARAKAEIATAAEATKQLGLSKEIQLDAQEMVRRAEYALGKSIRLGQESGSIAARGHNGPMPEYVRGGRSVAAAPRGGASEADIISASSFFTSDDERTQVYAVADHADPDEFEAALAEAKAEGNLSRSNVVRKVKGQPSRAVVTREMRADVIRDLAEQGYTSHQMVDRVSVSAETIRSIARDFDVDIPADKVMGKKHLMNHTESVDRFVTKVENTVSAFQYVDLAEVDFSQADEWVASLTASISALNRIKKQLAKEATHVV